MRNSVRRLATAGLVAGLWLGPVCASWAQNGSAVEEVVVTGSRLKDYDPVATPHVTVVKRADNLLVTVRVVCDTRDKSQRLGELKATLRNMVHALGKDRSIALGMGSEIVGVFDETMIESVVFPDTKADTHVATLLIKTPVTAGDTFDGASERITKFIDRVPKVGRTEILISGDWELTLFSPSRYRAEIITAVAADARKAAADFGEAYGVHVTGLEHPVQWYRAGPLDLALYIPYKLEIEPTKR